MNEWLLQEIDIAHIALGAAILGAGGGGSAYLGMLRVRQHMRAGRRIRVIAPEALAPDDMVISVGGMGAPTVGIEKLQRGDEGYLAMRALEAVAGRPARAVMSDEIGGANALAPMEVAALADLPVVDVDAMGRAFPELQMSTFFIHGLAPAPAALCDDKGNTVVFTQAQTPQTLEKLARALTVAMGCTAAFAMPPITGAQIMSWGVKYTLSQAWRMGNAVFDAQETKQDPVHAIITQENGRLLFRGIIVDVARWTTGGFARGRLELEGWFEHRGSRLEIELQNENLIARHDGEIVAMVPDLISVVDADTGHPISTEETRYGQRVAVLGLPCTPLLRTPEALAVVGPRAFGYDLEYQPLGAYVTPEPVVRP